MIPMIAQVYLHELDLTAGTMPVPPAVLRVLNSKACRSAIMFGAPPKLSGADYRMLNCHLDAIPDDTDPVSWQAIR